MLWVYSLGLEIRLGSRLQVDALVIVFCVDSGHRALVHDFTDGQRWTFFFAD